MITNATLSHLQEISARFPRVSIVGIGDEANSIVSDIFDYGSSGAQCVAVSTDLKPLENIRSHQKFLVPTNAITDAGKPCDSEFREKAVREFAELIMPVLAGADVAFVVAKMKERESATVAPLVADAARRSGAVTIGMAIMPLPSERDQTLVAYRGVASMRRSCHTVAITDASRAIPYPGYPAALVHDSADQIVAEMISGLAETLACPSTVNVDFAAFRELITHGGIAHVGLARSSSDLRVEEATMGALRGPLLYDNIIRSRGALLNLRGDASLTMEEAEMAAELVAQRIGWDAPVVMGAHIDESWSDGLQISVLLTGGAYPYIPGGYRRLPLEMYEMEPDGGEEGPIDLDLDLDQLEEP